MENDSLSLRIVDEIMEELSDTREGFVIDSDNKAEWALKKIAEERAEAQRYIDVCTAAIQQYQEKIRQSEEKLKSKTSFLEGQLLKYFETVQHQVTKTQETYKLPGGTLRFKTPTPEFKRDDARLLQWLKENEMLDYIKVEEKPVWAELKKKLNQSGEKLVTEDGQIVEGVQVVEKPPVFEVEV